MKILVFVLSLCFFQSAFAVAFSTNETEGRFQFDGRMLKEATNFSGTSTFREVNKKQELLVVFEVKKFEMTDRDLEEEFHGTYFESRYYPQIRMTLKIPGKIDTSIDGDYNLTVPARITIRKISQNYNVKLNLQIQGQKMHISFTEVVKLSSYQVPYSNAGSEIGQFGTLKIKGTLLPLNKF